MATIITDECINCAVCEPECPADAIRPDTEPGTEKWVEFNRKYAEQWPVIITKKDPLPEADERDGEEVEREGKLTICALADKVRGYPHQQHNHEKESHLLRRAPANVGKRPIQLKKPRVTENSEYKALRPEEDTGK